jgi:hypothetical protein
MSDDVTPVGGTPKLNGWNEWSIHVLAELKRLDSGHARILEKQEQLIREVAALNVKAGVWGLVGGALPALAAVLYFLLKEAPHP